MKIDTITILSQNKYKSLVTRQPYAPGQVICEIPNTAFHDRPKQHTVQVGPARHVEVGRLSYLNHSCMPNVILDTTDMLVYAARPVAPGEELTFFYPSTEWEMTVPFICLCGSPNCIHVVAGARFLPLSTLERHFLNRHIRAMMIDLLNGTEQHLALLK